MTVCQLAEQGIESYYLVMLKVCTYFEEALCLLLYNTDVIILRSAGTINKALDVFTTEVLL